MSSDQMIAVTTDALRGLIRRRAAAARCWGTAFPRGRGGVRAVRALVRIAAAAVRGVPVLVRTGRRMRQEIGLQLDYLVTGWAERWTNWVCWARRLQALVDSPVRDPFVAALCVATGSVGFVAPDR